MIPPEARQRFEEVINYEMLELDRQLAESFQSTAAELTRRGMLQSGAHIKARAELASNSLKTRAHYALGQLIRCLAAHGVSLDEMNTREAADLLTNTIEAQLQILLSRAFSAPGLQGPAMDAGRTHAMQTLGQEGPRLIKRMITELKLTASASKTRSDSTGATWNIGTVGVIQTGDGSQASVQQHFDTGAKAEVAVVLHDMLQQLNSDNSIANRDELRELIAETKSELEKPSGNGLKISSGLRTIADTTKFIESLSSAYGVLKPLLSQFGIHLP